MCGWLLDNPALEHPEEWEMRIEELITWPTVTVTDFTIKAYFHHDEISWKSVCRDVVSSCPSSPSSHGGGRPAHNTVPVQLLDSTRNLINLSELKNLAKCVLYANLTDLPPNWRHLRLFLPSSIPPTVSYTSCTPLEFSCVLCKYTSMLATSMLVSRWSNLLVLLLRNGLHCRSQFLVAVVVVCSENSERKAWE